MFVRLEAMLRNLVAVVAICNAERKYLQRTIRYRILCFLLFATGISSFLLCALVHGKYSSIDPNAGVLGVQYILPFVGAWMLLVSMMGSLFLCFDRHGRYRKARFEEVLYSRPFNNLQLLSGAVCATVWVLWVPTFITIATCFGLGLLLQWTDQVLYGVLEPWSLIGWLSITFPVACFFWAAIFVLLSSWLRISMLVFCLGGLLIVLEVVSASFMPMNYVAFTTSGFNSVFFPSTTLPSLLSQGELQQKVSLLLVGIAAICFSSPLHVRRDQSRKSLAFSAGVGAVCLAALSTFVLVQGVFDIQDAQERWREYHKSHRDSPRGDIENISGTVRIDPGTSMQLDLSIRVSTRELGDKSELAFTLNPGFTINQLAIDEQSVGFHFQDGLLAVNLPSSVSKDDTFNLSLIASGVPNPNFAYLDASLDVDSAIGFDNSLAEFGMEAALFEEDYVALMPGVRWLPSAGSYFPPSSSPYGARDFFNLDLSVEAPTRFEVVGPGTSTIHNTDGEWEITQFSPSAQISEVGLLASEFHRLSMEVEGLKADLLLHPYHLRTIDSMASIRETLKREFEDFVFLLRDADLDYDLGTLSFVEVPIQLRTIGGGWDMASVQALPGIVMMREHLWLKTDFREAFPPFVLPIQKDPINDPAPFTDPTLTRVANYFLNDFMGGNVFSGIARNLTTLRVNASGAGAPALEHFVEFLFVDLFFKSVHAPYYDALSYAHPREYDHLLLPPVLTRSVVQCVSSGLDYMNASVIRSSITQSRMHNNQVLSAAEARAIVSRQLGNSPSIDERLIDLRAHYASIVLLESSENPQLSAAIGRVVSDYSGQEVKISDLAEVAKRAGFLDEFLWTDWMTSENLAGYAASTPKVSRLDDLDDGTPQYRVAMNVRNLEEGDGVFSVFVSPGFSLPPQRIKGKSSLELNMVMSMLPSSLQLNPYLARNRSPIFFYPLHQNIEDAVEGINRVALVQESNWHPQSVPGIVVDDLDPGFSVVEPDHPRGSWLQSLRERRLAPIEKDNGVTMSSFSSPILWRLRYRNDRWYRAEDNYAWGNKYRQTTTNYVNKAADVKAVFNTTIPYKGDWNLDFHVSQIWVGFFELHRPKYEFTVRSGDSQEIVYVNLDAMRWDWLRIGSFELAKGEVTVDVQHVDPDEYSFLFADAIRWMEPSQVLEE